ncbi:MAG TPA: hypothetical protein VK133_03625 [Amoebophilaceae bacterium]|jgi:hypothetical protein|nr:hypothetical protein [Amoebophilaceae bacterium]
MLLKIKISCLAIPLFTGISFLLESCSIRSSIPQPIPTTIYQFSTVKPLYGTILPDADLYKLFIDRDKQHLGEDAFEDEPGYKSAMKQALRYMEQTLGEKLDAEELAKLRNLCVESVLGKKKAGKQVGFRMGYAPLSSYCLDKQRMRTMSPQAIHEFNQLVAPYSADTTKQLLYQTPYISTFELLDNQKNCLPNSSALPLKLPNQVNSIKIRTGFQQSKDLPRVKEIVNGFFDTYYKEIAKAQTSTEKLGAIAKLCRSIELFHVFPDGNGRTTCFILLPKLLRENGIAHGVILDDPATFDAGTFSIQEMAAQICQGIETFYSEFPMLQRPKPASAA